MLYHDDQAERSAAAGRPRLFVGAASTATLASVAFPGAMGTKPSTVIPTTKWHALNPAPRPEEAVSP